MKTSTKIILMKKYELKKFYYSFKLYFYPENIKIVSQSKMILKSFNLNSSFHLIL